MLPKEDRLKLLAERNRLLEASMNEQDSTVRRACKYYAEEIDRKLKETNG
jgi:hypothetical protein